MARVSIGYRQQSAQLPPLKIERPDVAGAVPKSTDIIEANAMLEWLEDVPYLDAWSEA